MTHTNTWIGKLDKVYILFSTAWQNLWHLHGPAAERLVGVCSDIAAPRPPQHCHDFHRKLTASRIWSGASPSIYSVTWAIDDTPPSWWGSEQTRELDIDDTLHDNEWDTGKILPYPPDRHGLQVSVVSVLPHFYPVYIYMFKEIESIKMFIISKQIQYRTHCVHNSCSMFYITMIKVIYKRHYGWAS